MAEVSDSTDLYSTNAKPRDLPLFGSVCIHKYQQCKVNIKFRFFYHNHDQTVIKCSQIEKCKVGSNKYFMKKEKLDKAERSLYGTWFGSSGNVRSDRNKLVLSYFLLGMILMDGRLHLMKEVTCLTSNPLILLLTFL